MSGFKLAPSRLNRPPSTEVSNPTRTNFTGLTASKLGLLAESKLSPSTGAIQAKSSNGDAPDEAVGSVPASLPTPTTFSFTPLSKPKEDNSEVKNDSANDDHKDSEANKIAGSGDKASANTPTAASIPVFGENLAEKVTKVPIGSPTNLEKDVGGQNQGADGTDIFGAKAKNGDSGEFSKTTFVASSRLFANAASKVSDDESEKKTLSESAAEYTETHTNKRKYDVVDVVTGEESESNVLQAQVKLYIFDKEKRNWTERGRGLLRLNDSPVSTPGHLKSRLVMRTTGNMRVVLNTKLWPDMICEKANEKNVRISALDEGEVKIFLIACSIKEAEKLFTALEYRISQLKTNKEAGEEEDEEETGDGEEEGGEPPEKKPAPSEEA